jgi:hypothetical protein
VEQEQESGGSKKEEKEEDDWKEECKEAEKEVHNEAEKKEGYIKKQKRST